MNKASEQKLLFTERYIKYLYVGYSDGNWSIKTNVELNKALVEKEY